MFALFRPQRIASVLIICIAAWQIIAHAMTDLFSADEPYTALVWDKTNPVALTTLAQEETNKPGEAHLRTATEYAAQLIERDPLAPGALSLYGVALARLGEVERAEKIIRVAAAHLPIDLTAHAWLYGKALRRGDLSSALAELDILLRARPFLAPQMIPSVQALLRSGVDAEAGFARLLESTPPWRAYALAHLSGGVKDPNTLVGLYRRLQASTRPPSTEEMRPYLDRLVRDSLFDQAYLAWIGSLPQERLSKLGLLYNNDFKYPISNLPFDWEFIPVAGASTEIINSGKDRALNIEFYGSRIWFANVRHLLVLSPGSYSFSGYAKADGLENERGLRWRIYCADNPGASLATTALLSDTTPWRPFQLRFAVPAEGCATQWLALEIPARIVSETQVSGSAGYRSLAIDGVAR